MSSASSFSPGQRWISSTEPELGLGVVLAFDGRIAQIAFPAAEEERAYSAHNAPLSRVHFAEGEEIEDEAGARYVVLGVEEQGGFLRYRARAEDGAETFVPEVRLSSAVRIHGPRERLLTGQLDKLGRYALRIATSEQQWQLESSPARGLLGARVELLQHQCYLAAEIGARSRPRVLLADEVGLGKTIEAGLIIRKLAHTGRANRVLIIVPDSLLHQWLVEMLRRFHLQFTILDEARCQELEASGADDEEPQNPFESAQLVLCPASLLFQDAQRLEQALQASWDLLAVDEAHHLEWQPSIASDAYMAVAALAEQTPAVLLLTATPEQLGQEGHFARLRLLDPERFPSLESFVVEQQDYQAWGRMLEEIEAADDLAQDPALVERLQSALDAETVAAALASDTPVDMLEAELLDRHGTGRALFRNTRESVGGFPPRVLSAWPLEPPSEYQEAEHLAELGLLDRLRPERVLGESWFDADPRLQWLRGFLQQHRQDKVLLICASAETVQDLDQALRLAGGAFAAVFHEGMSLLERDRAAAWFAEPEHGAQVLLCSEIGSEGRNFQFAQHLILFDLPLDCELLEQRIGRLDRIGHQGDVRIHVPYYQGTAMERLLAWYRDALGAFNGPVAGSVAVQRAFAEELDDAVAHGDSDFAALIERGRDFVAQAREQEHAGRDRLLERNSCRPAVAQQLIEQIQADERAQPLEDYLERAFDELGVESEPLGTEAWLLRPGPRIQPGGLPGLPEEGLAVTFSRAVAVQRDDLEFLSWEHPLVLAILEQLGTGDFGSTCLCSVPLRGLAAGSLLLAAEYRVHCPAPRALQIGRYMPLQPLRVLLDQKGRDLGQHISFAQLVDHAKRVPRQHAPAIVRQARPLIEQGLKSLQRVADAERPKLLDTALSTVAQQRGAAQRRLQALAEVNPLIGAAEVEMFANETREIEAQIRAADWRLDSIMLAIVSPD